MQLLRNTRKLSSTSTRASTSKRKSRAAEAVAWLESTRIGLTMSWNRACLAEALALSSHRDEASTQASKALERLSAKDRLGEAAAHRALGIAAGIAGTFADSAPHFERSLV